MEGLIFFLGLVLGHSRTMAEIFSVSSVMQGRQIKDPIVDTSKVSLEIAKEQVSADYQRQAASKKFAAEREVLLLEQKNLESQILTLRQANAEIATHLKKAEALARTTTDRCRTLELARKNEETLRSQAEQRESNLFNLLVTAESKCRAAETEKAELERQLKIHSHLEQTISALESTILELKSHLQQCESKAKEKLLTRLNEREAAEQALMKQVAELMAGNASLEQDVERLKRRNLEVIVINSEPAGEVIAADFLAKQQALVQENETIDAKSRSIANANSQVKVRASAVLRPRQMRAIVRFCAPTLSLRLPPSPPTLPQTLKQQQQSDVCN